MESKAAISLTGVNVLVTRPAHQSQELCALIARAGGQPIPFPVLEILDPSDGGAAARALLATLDSFDMAVFISTNAVQRALALMEGRPWPTKLRVAAIGLKTAELLNQSGIPVTICPPGEFSSEALLALPALKQVAQKRIIIFRGEGGRELLPEVLRQRGAIIEYAEVYRRGRPEGDFTQLTPETVDVAIVTSNEGLRNLWDMASDQGRAWLVYLPLVVMSRRTAQLAEELGFVCPAVVAPEQTDAGLVRALHYWRESLDPPVFRNIG